MTWTTPATHLRCVTPSRGRSQWPGEAGSTGFLGGGTCAEKVGFAFIGRGKHQ